MKTWVAKTGEVDRAWWIVDATDKTVGRLATEIARTLRGKNKPEFTPHTDTGDFVVVINSDKVKFTGNKWEKKTYYRHTGFFGGLKSLTAQELLEKDSTQIVTKAVRGMLPRNKLSRQMIKKLKVYTGGEHPHAAQSPQPLNVN